MLGKPLLRTGRHAAVDSETFRSLSGLDCEGHAAVEAVIITASGVPSALARWKKAR